MTLAIHHALRTSERATRATQFIGRFQNAPRLRKSDEVTELEAFWVVAVEPQMIRPSVRIARLSRFQLLRLSDVVMELASNSTMLA